jgi:hypothetical protein
VTGAPKANILPSVGEVRVRVGVEAVATWMLTVRVPVRPERSAAEAVIVWVPTLRLLLVKVAPVPIWPSMLEVHTIADVPSPSSESRADAVKVIGRLARNFVPETGALMVTTGGTSVSTVMVTVDMP